MNSAINIPMVKTRESASETEPQIGKIKVHPLLFGDKNLWESNNTCFVKYLLMWSNVFLQRVYKLWSFRVVIEPSVLLKFHTEMLQ